MVDWEFKEKYDLNDFIALIDVLRAPGGCPWDIKQTHESLKRNAVEEAWEVCDAIDEGSTDHLREELGGRGPGLQRGGGAGRPAHAGDLPRQH